MAFGYALGGETGKEFKYSILQLHRYLTAQIFHSQLSSVLLCNLSMNSLILSEIYNKENLSRSILNEDYINYLMVTFFFFYFIAINSRGSYNYIFFLQLFEYVMFELGFPHPFFRKQINTAATQYTIQFMRRLNWSKNFMTQHLKNSSLWLNYEGHWFMSLQTLKSFLSIFKTMQKLWKTMQQVSTIYPRNTTNNWKTTEYHLVRSDWAGIP